MTTDSDYYIAPEEATRVRIFPDGFGTWQIDAADEEDRYTEVCWDSRYYTDEKGERHWEPIRSPEEALELVPAFVAENVPHLEGTEPVVSRDTEDGSSSTAYVVAVAILPLLATVSHFVALAVGTLGGAA